MDADVRDERAGDLFVVVSKMGCWNGEGFVSDWRTARHFRDYEQCLAASDLLSREGVTAVPRYIAVTHRPDALPAQSLAA
jgi:hypothetical protein